MQAIVLVGGFGTRLQSVVSDVPKPMAPIAGKPFLAHLLDYLRLQGVNSVVFPVHHMREKIQDYFQSSYNGLLIQYVEEETPLGTGGAIVNALRCFEAEGPVLVLNGDTFVKLDYQGIYQQHIERQSALTIALRSVEDCSRYGGVLLDGYRISGFSEKGTQGQGLINAGVYVVNPDLFARFDMPELFSFEADFVQPYLDTIQPQGYITSDYFIDIGVPDDYEKAQTQIPMKQL